MENKNPKATKIIALTLLLKPNSLAIRTVNSLGIKARTVTAIQKRIQKNVLVNKRFLFLYCNNTRIVYETATIGAIH